mmetsp:Transcript_16984/g.45787  ORF Transcript_16984/g.45787 Transcript_16984/m.45787 type:complete len:223 (+) Transcript_16984:2451-3119(+)
MTRPLWSPPPHATSPTASARARTSTSPRQSSPPWLLSSGAFPRPRSTLSTTTRSTQTPLTHTAISTLTRCPSFRTRRTRSRSRLRCSLPPRSSRARCIDQLIPLRAWRGLCVLAAGYLGARSSENITDTNAKWRADAGSVHIRLRRGRGRGPGAHPGGLVPGEPRGDRGRRRGDPGRARGRVRLQSMPEAVSQHPARSGTTLDRDDGNMDGQQSGVPTHHIG